MLKEPEISLFDLIECFSDVLDMLSREVVNHHKQVAYISKSLGEKLSLTPERQTQLVIAGALHDIGAFSLRERLDALNFEIKTPHNHAETGYQLLRIFTPLTSAAEFVRFHHVPWNKGEGKRFQGQRVPLESHILHLADRVSVLAKKYKEDPFRAEKVCRIIKSHKGTMFKPEIVDALLELSKRECFWFDLASNNLSGMVNRLRFKNVEIDSEDVLNLARVFSHVIDFRSPFTATHSEGVAACARAISEFVGFSYRESQLMKVAGYLHDLGKIAVPLEIIEKKGKLNPGEQEIMKSHVYYTYRSLERIKGFEVINSWAAFHHERLDGKGYPFKHQGKDLFLGSRIMAVADVFTALTEDRPYRKGMKGEKALDVMQNMAKEGALDPHLVSLVKDKFQELNNIRLKTQEAATCKYKKFREGLNC